MLEIKENRRRKREAARKKKRREIYVGKRLEKKVREKVERQSWWKEKRMKKEGS